MAMSSRPSSAGMSKISIRHSYIKHGIPQLNGKVERSHRSDQQEWMKKLDAALAHATEGMPSHQQWIDKYCRAEPI